MQLDMSSPTPQSQESSLYDNLQMHGHQIRLIEITSTQPEIVCKLEVVSLADEPPYSALSYVWGDPNITRSVLVNGKCVNVTTNLASALEHAPCLLEKSNVAPRLWADALCINQNDPNEKNHQVPFMKEIYSQAEIVICWLGPPNGSIHGAIDWIDIIARECSFACDEEKLQDGFHDLSLRKDAERFDHVNTPSQTKSGVPGMGLNEAITLDSSGPTDSLAKDQESLHERFKGPSLAWLSKYPSFYELNRDGTSGLQYLLSIFKPPYWTRVWIFQEVTLAKKPIFACGTRFLSLASLDRLACWAQWLTGDKTIIKPQVMNLVQWEVTNYISHRIYENLGLRFEARRTAGHPISSYLQAKAKHAGPESHWRMACNLSTSNPKDYFYAFLSLSRVDLVPDYSPNTSVGMVCRDFIVEYVRASRKGSFGTKSGELDLLAFAGVGHDWYQYPDTPSWAPNFPGLGQSERRGSPVFSSRVSHFENLVFPSSEKTTFSGSDMQVTALILDTIQDLGPVREDINDDGGPEWIIPWIVDFAATFEEYVAGYHPMAALHSLLHFESIVQDESPLSIPDIKNAKGFIHWVKLKYKDEVLGRGQDADSHKSNAKVEYLNQLLGGLPIDMRAINEERRKLSESCLGKAQRLAETSFRYIGIFPLHVQPGDVVCVLNGLRYPAVLRKVDEHYAFVGTCFIQGLESAKQVWQLAEKKGTRVETIVIR